MKVLVCRIRPIKHQTHRPAPQTGGTFGRTCLVPSPGAPGEHRQPPGSRIMDVDAFRAVALLGILLVNLASIASGYPLHLVAGSGHDSWLNRTAVRLVEATLTMKANLLFSFLFGYSFTAADPLRGAPWGSIRPAVPPPSRRPVRDRNAARRPAVRGRRPDHTRGFRPDPLHDAAGQHPPHPGHCAALLGTVAFAVALTASTGAELVPDPAAAPAALTLHRGASG